MNLFTSIDDTNLGHILPGLQVKWTRREITQEQLLERGKWAVVSYRPAQISIRALRHDLFHHRINSMEHMIVWATLPLPFGTLLTTS
jgi:hypothetical protein